MRTRLLRVINRHLHAAARGAALLAMLYGAPGLAAAQAGSQQQQQQQQRPQPFDVGEMQRIVTRHATGPLLVNFWSAHCAPCLQELPLLKQLAERHRHWQLVLVSTDGPEQTPAVIAALRRHGIDPARTWLFAEANAPTLRFDVDRRWTGELPRSYFFIDGRRIAALSGKVDTARIEQLLATPPASAMPRSLPNPEPKDRTQP